MKHRQVMDYYLKMDEHYIEVPYYNNQKRRVRVLLPRQYHKEEEHYPVLYMHDGQNVFYSKESYSGHSWKLIKILKLQLDLPKMIVVGIDNAEERRLDEYSPWQTEARHNPDLIGVGGDGHKYGDWVVNTVMPYINQRYRTLTGPENTLLAGSSMGGNITAYMGSAYPDVFGSLGIFSLASWFSEEAFIDYIHKNPLNPNTKVYIQVGTEEGDGVDAEFIEGRMDQTYIDSTLNYHEALIRTGHSVDNIWLRILVEETHHEYWWAAHFSEFLRYSFEMY